MTSLGRRIDGMELEKVCWGSRRDGLAERLEDHGTESNWALPIKNVLSSQGPSVIWATPSGMVPSGSQAGRAFQGAVASREQHSRINAKG